MPDPIADAIIDTLIYADLFDYALTPDQIFRYLIGVRTSRQEVDRALNDHARLNGSILRFGSYLACPTARPTSSRANGGVPTRRKKCRERASTRACSRVSPSSA